jgi:hypothetical protein
MTAAAELVVNKANTKAFIDNDPSTITINRDTYISDGAGGKKKSGSPTTTYVGLVVRMIPQGADNATSNPITQTTNGSLDRPDFVLLGEAPLDIQRNDYFTWRGETWEVISIRKSPTYETKVDVRVRKDS